MALEDIKKMLFSVYGITSENDNTKKQGCYINGKWLSIENVIKIIRQHCDD